MIVVITVTEEMVAEVTVAKVIFWGFTVMVTVAAEKKISEEQYMKSS